jgi:hypothetical protein
VDTPATECLGKDEHGDPPQGNFNCSSIIGMLWYLHKHSRPELGFACSQVARFTFNPKRSHELALIRIGQYLKGTRDKGLIMKPTTFEKFAMDCWTDSDFMGKYGTEQRSDPENVKSRGGYIISINGCPISWQSKLIDTICLSTMMAEYYALSIAMREVLPLRELVCTVGRGLQLDDKVISTFKVTVWEDNMGALTLANMDPGQNTSRSKHFDSKTHHFRQHLQNKGDGNDIVVCKVASDQNVADIQTKPLSRELFQRLRKMIMGW